MDNHISTHETLFLDLRNRNRHAHCVALLEGDFVKTYLLSETGKQCEWQVWKHLGGCGLSDYVQSQVGKITPKTTLGELQDKCIVAGRETARFALDHLNLTDWAIVEYDIADNPIKPTIKPAKWWKNAGFLNWQSEDY